MPCQADVYACACVRACVRACVPCVQKNEVDCGVFALLFCMYVSIDSERDWDFTQEDIPLIRRFVETQENC